MVIAFFFVSCESGIDPNDPSASEPKTAYIVNSAWVTVDTREVAASRDLTEDDLLAEVIAYNLATTDDQKTIFYDEVPPIEESPNVDAFIVAPDTHDILSEYLDWPRTDLVERREVWRYQAQCDGGVLYIDRIPPAPEPVIDTRTDYEKYALYLVAVDGAILYEEHCEDWDTGGYASQQAYFDERRLMYELEARSRGDGSYVVSGQIYTSP